MTDLPFFVFAFAIKSTFELTTTPQSQSLEKTYARIQVYAQNRCAGLWHEVCQVTFSHAVAPDIHTKGYGHMQLWDANTQVNMLKLAPQLVPLDYEIESHKAITAECEPTVPVKQ